MTLWYKTRFDFRLNQQAQLIYNGGTNYRRKQLAYFINFVLSTMFRTNMDIFRPVREN